MLQSQIAAPPAAKTTRMALNEELKSCVVAAAKVAGRAGSETIALEHLVLGLLDPPGSQLHSLLAGLGVDASNVVSSIKMQLPKAQVSKITVRAFDSETSTVLSNAGREAVRLRDSVIDSRHVLLSILSNPVSNLAMSLRSVGLTHERVLSQIQGQTQPRVPVATTSGLRSVVHVSMLFMVLIEVFALTGIGLALVTSFAAARLLLVAFIVSGWVIALCLHEFGHAIAAYLGGDTGIAQRGTLTIDPRKYTHPLLSIVLPLAFLAMGGIALPGGAVRIDQSRLRSKKWNLIVAVAGPIGTAISLLLLCIPFVLFGDHFAGGRTTYLWTGIAGLAQILAFVLILNLLPIPPLDGFRIVSSWLPLPLQQQALRLGWMPVLFLYVLLASTGPFSTGIWHATNDILQVLRVPGDLGAYALSLMHF